MKLSHSKILKTKTCQFYMYAVIFILIKYCWLTDLSYLKLYRDK